MRCWKLCAALFSDFEIFLQRFQHWDRLVEDVVFEISECFSLSGVLQSLALAQIDVVGKDKIDASIVIFVVIVLVGDQIDRLHLICIARCYHDLIQIFLAKSLDSSKLPNRAKENFIEDDHIVLRMVEAFDAILFGESDAKELIDCDAIRSVFLC